MRSVVHHPPPPLYLLLQQHIVTTPCMKLSKFWLFLSIPVNSDWVLQWLPKRQEKKKHSSRMRTICCSGRLKGGGCLPMEVSAQGRVCLGGCLSGECTPPPGHRGKHPPWTESQTGVRTLPFRNYYADGKNIFGSKKGKQYIWFKSNAVPESWATFEFSSTPKEWLWSSQILQ